MRAFGLLLFIALLGGCPPSSNGASGGKDAGVVLACVKFGDTCEFSPGKLGSCVRPDDCTTEPCLVCQSQH
ncbi:MAG: hypothetical protein ABI551_02315 [Polyangiaceae bacterium]